MGHTYIFLNVVYLKFTHVSKDPVFLFAKSGSLKVTKEILFFAQSNFQSETLAVIPLLSDTKVNSKIYMN